MLDANQNAVKMLLISRVKRLGKIALLGHQVNQLLLTAYCIGHFALT